MTEYTNNTNTHPTGNKTGRTYHMELPDDHRSGIAQACFIAFSNTKDRQEFRDLIRRIKPLCLWKSETPTLDEAYIDGFMTALSILKKERKQQEAQP